MEKPIEGFIEIDHTADWALKVWAGSLESLFTQAAIGMETLAETVLHNGSRVSRRIQLDAVDVESLLVVFLNELLFIGEQENYGFDTFDISIRDNRLKAEIFGSQIASRKKEIKAVTFHALEIKPTDNGFEIQIVFDV